VPQGSVLGPVLYLIYTSDLPQPAETNVATFADDTAVMAVGGDVEEVTDKLQRSADEINSWTRQWLIKPNADKSIHVNFTKKRCTHIPIIMNGKPMPHSQTGKYPGMTLDGKLRWTVHVKKRREELGLKYTNTCTGLSQIVSGKLTRYTCADITVNKGPMQCKHTN